MLFFPVIVGPMHAPCLVDLARKQGHLALHGGKAAGLEAPQLWVQGLLRSKEMIYVMRYNL